MDLQRGQGAEGKLAIAQICSTRLLVRVASVSEHSKPLPSLDASCRERVQSVLSRRNWGPIDCIIFRVVSIVGAGLATGNRLLHGQGGHRTRTVLGFIQQFQVRSEDFVFFFLES